MVKYQKNCYASLYFIFKNKIYMRTLILLISNDETKSIYSSGFSRSLAFSALMDTRDVLELEPILRVRLVDGL